MRLASRLAEVTVTSWTTQLTGTPHETPLYFSRLKGFFPQTRLVPATPELGAEFSAHVVLVVFESLRHGLTRHGTRETISLYVSPDRSRDRVSLSAWLDELKRDAV